MRGPHLKEATLDLSFYRDWVSRRKKEREKDVKKPTFFVTISREFGCEGYEFALKLVEKLNERHDGQWNLFTRKMIEEIASGEDILPEMVHEISEKRWSFKDWFVDALVPTYLQSPSSHVFKKMRNLILNLADKGNCVILGGGSQIVTHRLDPKKFFGVHIRVVASHEWRLKRIGEIDKLTRDAAEHTMRARQDSRDKFILDFTGLNAGDPSMYSLIFNNARNDAELMANTVVEYLRLNGAFD